MVDTLEVTANMGKEVKVNMAKEVEKVGVEVDRKVLSQFLVRSILSSVI